MNQLLKSLELNGYKTFASKTKIEFSGDVTVVVGPNGSGKSNIADSIRWVLGEQSYSILRGRKTDDMIFAGSATRPRAGMASATLTFDNSDGWLPIEFSEVSITRRAYRDGKNEYLINNKRVRLADVVELMSKSGLAERTYTVIGQGLVDDALSLKADERRRLFEEAAGIGLYRKRKMQSLRRMDTTRRNLERVQDILAELKPRLRSLERQSRKAQEYEQIRQDLQEILKEWYGYHWFRNQKLLINAKTLSEKTEKELDDSREKQIKIDNDLNETREIVNSLRAQIGSWHRQLSQIHLRREQTSRNLAVSSERKKSLDEEKARLLIEKARLDEDLVLRQTQFENAKSQAARSQVEVNEAIEQEKDAREKLEIRQNKRVEVEEKVQSLRQGFASKQAQKAEFDAKRKELNKRLANYTDAHEKALNAVISSRKALAESERKYKESSSVHSNLELQVSGFRNELERLQKDEEVVNNEIKEQQDKLNQLETELSKLRARSQVLAEAEENMLGYAEGARFLMQAAQKGKIRGAQGLLSNELTVEPEYEQAIATALGDFLDAVLVDDRGDVENALSLLEKDPGKAALLLLSNIHPENPVSSPQIEGCFGTAADLVSAPHKFRPILDLLLGRVLIVRDRNVAQQIISRQTDINRVVTLNGEVFHGNGLVQVNNKGGAVTLSRPRERKEILEKIVQIEKDIIKIQDDLNKSQSQKAGFQKMINEQAQNEKNLSSELGRTLKEFNTVVIETEQLRNMVNWHQDQLEAIDNDADEARKEIETIDDSYSNVDQNLGEVEEELRVKNLELKDFYFDELLTQVSHWETQVNALKRVLVDVENVLIERKENLDNTQSQINANRSNSENVGTQLASLDENEGEMRGSEGVISGEIEELSKLIDGSEGRLTGLEEQLRELETNDSLARRMLINVQKEHSQAQIKYTRKQQQLENMRRRIEDDFGLVALDYEKSISGPTPLPFSQMVQRLVEVDEIEVDLEDVLKRKRLQLRRMGAINIEAQQEYLEVKERIEFLLNQMEDLKIAEKDIIKVIEELDLKMGEEFRKTFDVVAGEFKVIFARLFRGGSANLILTDEDNLNESGVDIEARLPGKRMQRLAMLSGGERAMTAVALVFALIKASPTPFCIMDEVDATLDEANVSRLRDLITELSEKTQFILITHNRNTVQVADLIYGITLGRDTTSQMISLKLEEVDEKYSS